MGIETILMCFIADEEMFKIEDRFAEAELMSTVQKTAQAHKALKAGTKVHQVQVTAKVWDLTYLATMIVTFPIGFLFSYYWYLQF